MKLINLLENKNKCLRQFLTISEKFLTSSPEELLDVTSFYSERDAILKMIAHLDEQISVEANRASNSVSEELKNKIRNFIDERVRIVKSILIVDQKIIKFIELEKDRVFTEINETKITKGKMSKFKSKWITPSGEKVDRKL